MPACAHTIAGPVEIGKRVGQCVGAHPALVVGGDPNRRGAAESEQAQCGVDRRVGLFTAEDAHPGCTDEPVVLDVPARLREHRMTRGGQAGGVGGLPSGDESDAGTARKSEDVDDPRRRDLFDGGGRRRQSVESRILVPRGHQPFRGQRGGQRAADHESEVAGTRSRHKTGFRTGGERVDDGCRVLAVLRERAAQRVADPGGIDAGGHRPVVEAVEELLCVLRGGGQACGAIAHGKMLSASGITARIGPR